MSRHSEERAGREREPMATCWRPRMRNGREMGVVEVVLGEEVEVEGVEAEEDEEGGVEDGGDDDAAVVNGVEQTVES